MIFQDPLSSLHPVLPGRRPARGGGARAPRRLQAGGAREGDRDARARRHPGAALARRRLPARVLGRHAPARDDRHGADQRAEAADRRRADDRARRDRPGADPRADRAAAGGDRDRRDHDHPRPRASSPRSRDEIAVMYAGRVVERAPTARAVRRAAASVHVGPAALDPAAGHAARRGARADRGPPAVAHHAATGCAFHPRCPFVREAHKRIDPQLEPVDGKPDHDVACLLAPQTRAELWQRLARRRAAASTPVPPSRWETRHRTLSRQRRLDRGPRPRQGVPDQGELPRPPPARRRARRRRHLLRRQKRRDVRHRGRVAAAASRRPRGCCCACSSRPPARSGSTAARSRPSARTRSSRCGARCR